MPLLVNSVPNLAQGVSQQPDNLRFPGQCDEQINAWATVVEGLVKRPNTRHISKLFTRPISDDSYVQYIDRDENNKFACVLENKVSVCAVSIFNLNTGNPVTQVSISADAQTYLNNISNPREDVKALTVADYTFIANKEQTVSISSNSLSPPLEKEALVVVNLGDYDKNYSVYINDQLVPWVSATTSGGNSNEPVNFTSDTSYRSGDGTSSHGAFDADTELIASDLKALTDAEFNNNTGIITSITVTSGGSGWLSDALQKEVRERFRPVQDAVLEVGVIQYDTGVLKGYGAVGRANVVDGVVQSVTMISGGSGYDSSYDPPKFVLFEILPSNGWAVRFFLDIQAPYPTADPTFTATIGIRNSFKTQRRHSVFKIAAVARVANDGVIYKCIQDHTSAASNEPGTGVDYRDYWVEDDIAASDLATTWTSGIAYSIGTDFSVRTTDGLGDAGLTAIYKEVKSITDLPAKCFNKFRVKVIGSTNTAQDDYYVIFKTKDNNYFGEGSWIETVGWEEDTSTGLSKGIELALKRDTLPLQLKPTDDTFDNWTLSTAEWTPRIAGDNLSNPAPSFVGSKIKDIFFFKNRLGFLTQHNIIFSEADEYFNFWRSTVLSLLDSAPIDVGISHTKVVELKHAITFQEKLLLFSDSTQFVLKGNELLTPKTVSITPTTEYDSTETITPLALNNYLYFNFKRNNSSGFMEYYIDNDNNIFDAVEITAQIPTYIPSTIELMAGCGVENLLVTISSDRTTLFVYKFFWQNKEKIQSAWQKFTFTRSIVSFHFINSDLYIITKDSSNTFLEKLPMENRLQDQSGYNLLLDSRIDGSTLTTSYSASTKTTTISNFPYDPQGVEIYTKKGHKVAFTRTSATEGTVSGTLASYADQGGSYVSYAGVKYYCIESHTSTSVFETQKWRKATNPPSVVDSWQASTSYIQGTLYKCETTHTSPSSFVAVDTSVTPNITYWTVSTDVTTAPEWVAGRFYNNEKYFFAGVPYDMLYRFSDQTLKQPTERGGRSSSNYAFQTIRSGSLNYAETGHFTVEVTPKFRDTYSYAFNPDVLGSNLTLNNFVPQDGHFRFPVQAQPNDATIQIKSSSALPVKILAAEFESMMIPRSRRYGG